MNPQLNWQKLKGEFNKLTDVERLKEDLQKMATEIRRFDFHTVLTPQAKERVKAFEKKYSEIIKTVHQAQRQVDREVNKLLRQVKGSRILADVRLEDIRKVANVQRDRLNESDKRIAQAIDKSDDEIENQKTY